MQACAARFTSLTSAAAEEVRPDTTFLMKRSKARAAQTAKHATRVPHSPSHTAGSLKIPPILLEGDEPSPLAGPGGQAATESGREAEGSLAERRELPESYGTSRLLLLARDPLCLYAHWDLSSEQQRSLNQRSADGHLMLRLHSGQGDGPIAAEIQLHPESLHRFVPVTTAGATYVAELGYQDSNRLWVSVAISNPAATPSASVSSDKTVRFATMPDAPTIPHGREAPAVTPRSIPPPRVSWIPVLGLDPASPAAQFLEGDAFAEQDMAGSELPELQSLSATPIMDEWTIEQERALSALCGFDAPGKAPLSSIDLPRVAAGPL